MSERLQRLLLVVPAALNEPGIPLEKLAASLDCTVDALVKDLDLLACVGAPPFNPDDLIEIELRDGGVYVMLPQAFERPTRLTATEAAALSVAGRALAPLDARVKSALGKLEEAVAPAQRELYDAMLERFAAPAREGGEEIAEALERACTERRTVEILYFAATEHATRPRRVKPRTVATIDGVAYLSAQNERGEERTYRLDRIARAAVLDETFAPLPEIDLVASLERVRRFAEDAELPRATVVFSAEVADAARARHPDGVRRDDGRYEASVSWSTLPWLVSYVLSWGGRARVTAPSEARAAVLEAVRRVRDAHSQEA